MKEMGGKTGGSCVECGGVKEEVIVLCPMVYSGRGKIPAYIQECLFGRGETRVPRPIPFL